ncbi:uncharacterized protein LOC142143093 [Mixophyes fleayi]|uniref:uncharacterized protein LOC142143093 n=1 Tax=Mixophyes fleayi TaxID=3061075 RepID=UPI003F4DD3A9
MDPFTIILSAVVILFLAYVFNNRKQHNYKNFPPGPKPLPIIGNIHMIDMSKPHKTFLEMSKKYGSVFSVQLGMTKTVVLCGYDTIKDALVNHAEEFTDRPETPLFDKVQKGYGIVMSNGENWKVMRRFTLSTLRDFGMGKKTIENKIIEEAECLTQAFKSYGGKPFNNLTIITAAVANIIVSILLSHRFDYEDPTILQIMSLINENVRFMGRPMVRLYNSFPSVMDWLPGDHRKIFENGEKFHSFIRATFTKQKEELDVKDQRNLIDAFLAKQQEGKPESTLYFHNDNLTILVRNLFIAGMETTATTLRWGLLLMMKHPDIQKKVQNEIERVIGSATPQIEHRKEMPYTDAVIHEIQRFGDIIPGSLPHATSQDITFRGYFIPKETPIIPLLSSALKDDTYFERPEEFYPEHFLNSQGQFKKNDAFIPFSLGKRSCAGENLAKMELFLFFTTLLQNFTFKAPPGAKLDLTPALSATNAPEPYEMCAIPRTTHCKNRIEKTESAFCVTSAELKILQKTLYAMDPFTIILSAVVILFLAYIFNNRKQHNYKNFPPGPKPLPIIGNIHMIDMSKPHKTFIEMSKKYGSVFSVQLGMTKTVVLCGYDSIKDALVNHAEEFADRPETPVFDKVQKGYGVVMSNGENWKVMRRFTLSTLRDFGMGKKTIENKIIEEAECLTQTFKSYGGKPFNNLTIINAAVANIIVSILLSHRFDYEDPTILQIMSLINENVRFMGRPMVRLYNNFPSVMDWLPGDHRKVFENGEKFLSFIRATFTKQKEELDVNDQRNLIDAFLAKQQEGKAESTLYFHNDNLTVLVGNLFAAGMETTTTTLRWGLLLMMKYPDIQKKVQNEIERVIGSASPKIEHRKEMPYTDAVIHEIQRFGDIVPSNLPHATSQDVTFRGYFIPKGTPIIPLLSSALKDDTYFEKPEEFYPEHFLDSQGQFKKNDAFIPFSMGKRSCAGENLAKMELYLFFTTLLQNFTFKAPPGAIIDLTPALSAISAPQPYETCAIPRS